MGKGTLRRIVVDERPYRWRFYDLLVVLPDDRSGPQLYVDWGWRDWLEAEGPGNEPHIITPRFVAEAVRFAVAFGWPSAEGGPPLRLGVRDGGGFVIDPDTDRSSMPRSHTSTDTSMADRSTITSAQKRC